MSEYTVDAFGCRWRTEALSEERWKTRFECTFCGPVVAKDDDDDVGKV